MVAGVPGDVAALVGQPKELQPLIVHLPVVHKPGIRTKVHGIALLTGQHPLLHQRVQADEIGIPREGGVGLIGGIRPAAVGGGAKGKDLPVPLPGGFQPVHKFIGRLVKAPNAIPGRQAGDGHQNTRVTVHQNSS